MPTPSVRTPSAPRLLGDIGGTNARFALLDAPGGAPRSVRSYRGDDYPTLGDAIRRYLADEGSPPVEQASIGIANPVTGDAIQMTNHHWSFSIDALRKELGLQRLLVLNDFTALALALPVLKPDELQKIGGGSAVPGKPLGLLGAGTGLGVSGLWPVAGGPGLAIEGEGGHTTLAAGDDDEAAVLAVMRKRFGHVSAERAVSGQGLQNLYAAVCELDGVAPETLSAAEVGERGRTGADARCERTLHLFFAFLGTVAGNLALTLGALGGVYIGGGIVPKLGDFIQRSRFRARFEHKGRMSPYVIGIPTFVVISQQSPALIGAARALDQQ